MVHTPPTPSLRSSSDSTQSLLVDSSVLYNDALSLSPLRRESTPERSTPTSSQGPVRKDSIGGENTRPARFGLKRRDSTKEFDFILARTASRRLDLRGGVMSLVKGCLGGGVMAIHESYSVCGLWTALPVNALLGVVLAFSMYELTVSAQKMYVRMHVNSLSYPELAEATADYGPWNIMRNHSRCFRHTVELFICINAFGGCSVYQTMIARQIKQLMEGTEGVSNTWPTVRVYIAILLLPCLIISVFTSLKHLAPFSIILEFFIALLIMTTIGYSSVGASTHFFEVPAFHSLDGLFELIGVSMFAMDGIVVTLAVENSLRNPKIFPVVLTIGMTIVVLVVMAMGAFGYWGFGESSLAPITINFPWGAFAIQLKMFLAIMTYITFALNFWVPSCMVWYYAAYHHDPERHWIWERVYRMLLVMMTSGVAMLLPSIAMLMGLLGSFCVSVLGLIIPAFITLCLDWESPGTGKYHWRVWKALFFILLGLTLCCIGTYANIRELHIYLTSEDNRGGIRAY